MRRLTDHDLTGIIGSTIEGYRIDAARVKRGTFTYSNHYGIALGRNSITEIVKAEAHQETHPFTVGERFTVEQRTYDRDSFKCTRTHVTYEIVKATRTSVQLKPVDGDGKVITRKPKKSYNGDWCFSVDDTCGNTFYKEAVTRSEEVSLKK